MIMYQTPSAAPLVLDKLRKTLVSYHSTTYLVAICAFSSVGHSVYGKTFTYILYTSSFPNRYVAGSSVKTIMRHMLQSGEMGGMMASHRYSLEFHGCLRVVLELHLAVPPHNQISYVSGQQLLS